MRAHSLGYLTDLFLMRARGSIEDHGDHLVVRSPEEPTYYCGNYLLYAAAPVVGDFERWTADFRRAFRDVPEVRHMTFGWDDASGSAVDARVLAQFTDARFAFEDNVVLAAGEVLPPPHDCAGVELRELATDADWKAALTCQIECQPDDTELAHHLPFVTKRVVAQRALVSTGLGRWFGAFFEGELAGHMGLFVENGLGRFQDVETRPGFRRRGVCAALVHHAATVALESLGAQQLVLVADPDDDAIRVYRSVGFRDVERQARLMKRPD